LLHPDCFPHLPEWRPCLWSFCHDVTLREKVLDGYAFPLSCRYMALQITSTKAGSGLVALNVWLAGIGRDPVTAWRWRKRGWLKTVNICGRQYISAEARAEFERRAAAGECSREHKTPAGKKAA
jgi:hypothetical protein